jgi:hypothetical protein
MIHILDRVYLTYAEGMPAAESNDKIPDNFIQIIDKDLLSIHNGEIDIKRLIRVKSVDELCSTFKSDNAMIKSILKRLEEKESDKVIIYADEESFNTFLIKWWKYLFKNISLETAYSLYQIFADSEKARTSRSGLFLDMHDANKEISYSSIHKSYWVSSLEDFREIFDSVVEFNFDSRFKSKCSIEFLCVQLLYGDREDLNKKAENKLKEIFYKKVASEVQEVLEEAQHYLYLLKHKELLGSNKNLTQILSEDKSSAVLYDDRIDGSIESLGIIEKEYGEDTYAYMLQIADTYSSIANDHPEFQIYDTPALQYMISLKGREPEVENLLTSEFGAFGSFSYQLFDVMIKKRRVNPFFLHAVRLLNNSTTNDTILKLNLKELLI